MNNFTRFLAIFFISYTVYFGSFLFTFLTQLNDKPFQSEDYIGTAIVPLSILKEGNLDLNEYYEVITKSYPHPDDPSETPYYLKKIGGNYYSIRPITTALLALPVYILPALLLPVSEININTLGILSHAGGAFITALSCGIFYLIAKQELDEKNSLILTAIYAFATNSLSISSQGLWQHGSSQLLIALGLYFIYKNRFASSALAFGFATIARPTNLLSLAIFGSFIFLKNKREGLKFYLISALPILGEFIFNYLVFGNVDNNEYGDQMSGWTANVIEGFSGLWISPSKGLLICSPFLVFTIPVIYRKLRNFNLKDLFFFIALAFLLHTIIMGKWYSWYGGYSWGTRMVADVLPLAVLLLIPFIKSPAFEKPRTRAIFFVLTAWSIFYHLLGIVYFDGIWHTVFDGKQSNWLWSIKDSQIVFTFKRILGKLGLIGDPIQEAIQRLKNTTQ